MLSDVVLIGGRSGTGKTSVDFEIHAQLSAAHVQHCLIDGDSLDMAHPTPWHHHRAERSLAAMWANYRALGYHRMIYTDTVSVLAEAIARSPPPSATTRMSLLSFSLARMARHYSV